ncbi:hypothetical protein ACFYRD_19020 [Streptomyces hirsutus]|uniref:hypothetical protein n=1 Tax=Streptomyces hirsutus TaxID=35620 RepID=UPI0033B82F9D
MARRIRRRGDDGPADELEAEYENRLRKHQVGAEDFKEWRPVRKARGRKAAVKQSTPGVG